jgi:hypothetical protein
MIGRIWTLGKSSSPWRAPKPLDRSRVSQSDRHPAEDYVKSLFADTPLP